MGSPVIMFQKSKQTSLRKKLSSIRDHRKKNRETREVAYTCRYTSEHLIPNSVLVLGYRLNKGLNVH